MKTTQLKTIAGCITALLLLVTVFEACKKNGAATTTLDITGKWVKVYNVTFRQVYSFSADNTVVIDGFATDSTGKTILGYFSESTGRYTVVNDSLKMTNLVYRSNPHGYGPLSALVTTGTSSTTQAFRLGMNEKKTQLYLYFTCPINADCLPSPLVFDKQ